MINRPLALSLFLSTISLLLSSVLNWHLYDPLVEPNGTKFSSVGEIANLPGVPVYIVFCDHLASRNETNAIRRNVLLLLVSGSVGWGIATFAVVFVSGFFILVIIRPKQSPCNEMNSIDGKYGNNDLP